MNRTFEEDLDKLRTRLIRMGSLVEEQVEFALKALHEGNLELARIVTERDDKVDKLDLKIDKQCQRIFALNQPVASDLRLLLAALKINNELERIGDMASNIAESVLKHPDMVPICKKLELTRLSDSVFVMLKSSIDSFINNDPDLAAHVIPGDNTIQTLQDNAQAALIEVMSKQSEDVAPGAYLLLILRNLGRMADHATNIAENVIFLVQAKLVRHRSVNEDGLDFQQIISERPTASEGD